MVTIREAVQNAEAFARTLLPQDRLSDLRLEEVEAGELEGQPVWQITLSMPARDIPPASVPAMSVLVSPSAREYKTFPVHKVTGEVLGMKIRTLAIT